MLNNSFIDKTAPISALVRAAETLGVFIKEGAEKWAIREKAAFVSFNMALTLFMFEEGLIFKSSSLLSTSDASFDKRLKTLSSSKTSLYFEISYCIIIPTYKLL